MLPNFLKTVLAVAVVLACQPAQAQNSTVAPATPSHARVLNLSAPPAPEEAASFYDNSHKDLGHALVWMQEANATQPRYWNLYTEARIHLAMKNYPAALATAVRARQLAQAACNDTYEHLSEAVIKLASPDHLAARADLARTN